ncbi:MAG: polymer-forming cytoskeletal protein [Leptolyngbyaceae cyanobacterium bins.59]|nr:polymer-forming cytoskeletal protein [Leptolyngbyaceae cyanobacterium bins.59]
MFGQKQTPSVTYLGKGSEFQGTLHVEGLLRVDGIVHGTVEVHGDLEVSPTGLIEGPEIRAKNLIVHGVVKSRITLEGGLKLSRTARLEGDVVAQSLEIEPGALYVGYIETRDVKSLPGMGGLPELVAGDRTEPLRSE